MAEDTTAVMDNPPADDAAAPAPVTTAAPAEPAAAVDDAPATAEPAQKPATLSDGDPPDLPAAPQDWPDDWRQRLAGEDKKSLKTLERMASPNDVFKSWAEMRADRDSGKYIRRPATRATEEEMAQFRKSLGVPDEPAGYVENLKLSNDRVLGDEDKPIVEVYAERLHKHNVTPAAMSEMVDTYFDMQQAAQEQQIESDAHYKVESAAVLKQEMGSEFHQVAGTINMLLDAYPEFKETLLFGRGEDGQLLGNNPKVIKTLHSIAKELHPVATMYGGGDNAGQSLDAEIAEIENFMRENRAGYFKDEKKQARYQELLGMRERLQSRQSAA